MLVFSVDQTLRPQESGRKSCASQQPTAKRQGVEARIRYFHRSIAACPLKEFKRHSQEDQTHAVEEIFPPGWYMKPNQSMIQP